MSTTERIAQAVADVGSECYREVDGLRNVVSGLEADLRAEQERRSAAQIAWAAEVATLTERVNALRSDRDCEKRLRKDAEDARERAMERIAELESQRFRRGSLADPEAAPAVAAINARLATDKAFATEFLLEIDTRGALGVGFSGGHCQTQEINYEPPPPLDWSDSTEGEKP